jgi:hypothetical protein
VPCFSESEKTSLLFSDTIGNRFWTEFYKRNQTGEKNKSIRMPDPKPMTPSS